MGTASTAGRGYSQKARDTGHFGTRLAVVKLSRLANWDASVDVTPESLKERGVLKALRDGVKFSGVTAVPASPSGGSAIPRRALLEGRARNASAAGAQIEEAAEQA